MDAIASSRKYYSQAAFMRVTATERFLSALAQEGITGLLYSREDDDAVTVETWRRHSGGPIVCRLTTTWKSDGYEISFRRHL